ncbi:MAG: AAA family ATPase, partial [Planctomycetota bacterium]
LQTAAERMLKGVGNRASSFTEVNEINGYFAGDMMVQRVRDSIKQLRGLGDQVKADDLQSRLKTIQEDAVRQLKDRKALYEDGDNVIRLGNHRFSVNRQPLELTIVERDGQLVFHLAGTGFFEPIDDERLQATREVWGQSSVSETDEVYRGEYLAWKLYQSMADGAPMLPEEFMDLDDEAAREVVQQFMGPRYDEGYVKGVHDVDGTIILKALLKLENSIGLLRYGTRARALGMVFWKQLEDGPDKAVLAAKVRGIGSLQELFASAAARSRYVDELRRGLSQFVETTGIFEPTLVEEAAQYLFDELAEGKEAFWVSLTASDLLKRFNRHLKGARFTDRLTAVRTELAEDPISAYVMLRDWVEAYAAERDRADQQEYVDEVAALMFHGDGSPRSIIEAPVRTELEGLVGSHPRIGKGTMTLNYCHFTARLTRYDNETVPRFREFTRLKKQLSDEFAQELRLDEFKPRVLSSFVRNQLIDKVYLPIMGDNLAKQMGTVGEDTRTDRMGLLLLISPPGYGKTTLMEYMANRLGVTFVKINGPAIGHGVTSLDPAEAPNAGAREEIEKLNLALEMGDNIMIYLDDIQHTHTELLQKFISLCDAQRRIEGVYKGRTRTYDLRGKKVAVVMAGNPYTESGEKFRLPDMLTNRADTYNLGDILGDHAREFVMSYLENSLTSNPVLGRLATSSQQDVYSVIKIAETDSNEGVEFQGNYSVDQINEFVDVMKKLITVRDVVLKVNEQYIASAGTDDRYRTEPPFLLQGSYRNMNRIAEKILPVMNDEEVWTVILSSYENDAQTLTTGAEANLLKFKELVGRLTDQEQARWNEIKKTFKKNQMFQGMQGDDKLSMAVRQLAGFGEGLDQIGEVLARGIEKLGQARPARRDESTSMEVKVRLDQVMDRIGQLKELAQRPTTPPVPPEVIDRLSELSDRLIEMARPKKKTQDAPPKLPPELAEKIDRMASEIEGLRKAESDQDQLLDEFQRSLVGMMEQQLETNE